MEENRRQKQIKRNKQTNKRTHKDYEELASFVLVFLQCDLALTLKKKKKKNKKKKRDMYVGKT